MSTHYFKPEHQQLIEKFYYCQSASTSGQTRQMIFNKLQPELLYLINNAIQTIMSSWSKEDKEEARQDALLKIWTVLQRLEKDRLGSALNFLWISTKNILFTIARQKNNNKADIVYNSEHPIIGTYSIEDTEQHQDIEQVRTAIMLEIDRKIIEQEKLNRINTIYLILLKEYLLANSFNSKCFQKFVCEKLGITRENFYQINYKLNIRSQVFNEKEW